MSNQGVWEGLGGPVNVNRPDSGDIDPTLDSCCRREVESNRKRAALEETLRRHDAVAQAERRKRHLIPNFSWGSGCRCCYDPNGDGGDYRALIEAREKRNLETGDTETDQSDHEHDEQQHEEEDDDDSDDEFDYLLDEDLPGQDGDDGVLKEIEQRRRQELEMVAMHQEAALQHGYGAHRQMHPARVLRASGLGGGSGGASRSAAAPGVVLHLFDPDSSVSGELDLYMEKLAKTYRGTKFLRGDGRSTLLMDAAFAQQVLPRLSPDSDMPTLVAIRDGVVVATCPKLHGFVTSNNDELEPLTVRDWLDHAHVLINQPPPMEELCGIRPEELALYDYLPANTEITPPQEERYHCGMPECRKTFPHDHVGIKTNQQDGLVVQEEEIVAGSNKADE